MSNATENRVITQTGRDTPMGRLMRAYWIPVLRSAQLVAGGDPVPFKIMGEKLVAFRSPDGTVGVLDEACPHRRVSLALGANEECGLRCIYHGWLFAPSGAVLEAPTHPTNTPLARFPNIGHPVEERQGMIWAWLGDGAAPAFPKLAFTDLPDDQVTTATAILHCNWLHPLETLWDIFHAQILHNQTNRASVRANVYFSDEGRFAGGMRYDYPKMLVERTDYGFALTNADSIKQTHHKFVLPFFQFHATTPEPTDDKAVQISVPVDDDHVLLWMVFFNRFGPLKADGIGGISFRDVEDRNDFMKPMGGRTRATLWGQNRASIRAGETFNGVVGMGSATLIAEDVMVIESQEQIDRSAEFLAPTDRAVVEGRRTVYEAAMAHEAGAAPIGRDLDLSDVEALFVSLKQREPAPA